MDRCITYFTMFRHFNNKVKSCTEVMLFIALITTTLILWDPKSDLSCSSSDTLLIKYSSISGLGSVDFYQL